MAHEFQHAALIAIGSNIDPDLNVPLALEHLSAKIRVEAVSNFYWSAAVSVNTQPGYLTAPIDKSRFISHNSFCDKRVMNEKESAL